MRHVVAESPSVTLERGIGRLGPPLRRRHEMSPSPSPPSRRRKRIQTQPTLLSHLRTRPTRTVVLFAVLAALVMLVTFAFLLGRYWRWDTRKTRSQPHFSSPSLQLPSEPLFDTNPTVPAESLRKGIDTITYSPLPIPYNPSHDERYLAWLPHSGFHNQRVSLENALILARLLNRTLIIPPVRVGKAIRYSEFGKLRRHIALSSKIGLEHCTRVASFTPRECIGNSEFTMLPWSFFIDLHALSHIVPVVERWDPSSAWLTHFLNVSRPETIYIKDSRPYQHQLYDDRTSGAPLKPRYSERLNIEDLHDQYKAYRLLHFGSLFGSSRLQLKKPVSQQIRREVRERMVFANPVLLGIARHISAGVGSSGYYGLHLRLGDGQFQVAGEANVRLLWWSLMTGPLRFAAREAQEIEAKAMGWGSQEWLAPPSPLINVDDTTAPASGDTVNIKTMLNKPSTAVLPHTCREPLNRLGNPNNITVDHPIFIATDAPSPRTNPSLLLFQRTLPCLCFLSDFEAFYLGAIRSLRNNDDGLPLERFLLPFVDSMVAAMGKVVIGTPHSTFSRFTADVLHRMYHGVPIIERGK